MGEKSDFSQLSPISTNLLSSNLTMAIRERKIEDKYIKNFILTKSAKGPKMSMASGNTKERIICIIEKTLPIILESVFS